jgi:N-acetylmuramoyl-L-alanine amidase
MIKTRLSRFLRQPACRAVVISASIVVGLSIPSHAQVTTETDAKEIKPASILHVVIDPGHGGKDTGATRYGLKESEIALKVSNRLAELLRENSHFKISMTRTHDEKMTLSERTRRVNSFHGDVLISIHLNSSTDPRAQGKEFYFQNQLPADEEALFLASRENNEQDAVDVAQAPNEKLSPQSDLKRILEDLNRNERIYASSELGRTLYENWVAGNRSHKAGSRGIRQAPFQVVSNVTVPSVLIEIGFISHPQEGPRLGKAEYQTELARSIYEGLNKYKEIVDKDRPKNLKSIAN